MFDMLTSDQLFNLHTRLYDQATSVHHRMIGPDGYPRLPVFSDEWAILSAWHADICDMQLAAGAELNRRAEERELTRDA